MAAARRTMSAAAAVLVIAALAAMATAQTSSTCISMLLPCQADLNSTKPSQQCCTSMKSAIDNELPCLCSLLKNKDLGKSFNMTQALELPKKCGINKTTSICDGVTAAASPAGSPGSPPAGSGSPAGTTPGTPPGNGVHGLATIGMSGLMSLLLFWSFIAA